MLAAVKRLLRLHNSKGNDSPDAFTTWCQKEVFTPDMVRATAILERACDLHLAQIYRNLGVTDFLAEFRTAAEVAGCLGFVESADIALEAMLYRLATRGTAVSMNADSDPPEFRAAEDPPDPESELDELRREMKQIGPDFTASLEFLDFGAERYVKALKDDPDLMDRMLSGRDPDLADLWNRTTNMDPLQDVHGKMGAMAVTALFPGGTVLEIGGGTGNGIRHLFQRLAEQDDLGRIRRYIFTDISTRFVLNTRHAIKKQYPSVPCAWRFVDINRALGDQKLPPESVDLVYGVNAAHVAQDILGFLRECHSVLRPGGQVIFAERIRHDPHQMAPRELTLNLSIYHRTAAQRNVHYRPMHSYLAPDNWLRVLEMAGFAESRICPELDIMEKTLPNPYAAVVIAIKE